MSFVEPWALYVAAAAAVAVIGLHFLTRRRPRTVLFPTARFVPQRTVRAPSRSTRPTEPLLLLLRVAAALLLGAAFARPLLREERRPLARVVALDRSASVASIAAARDSAARYLRAGDLLVVFDSVARLVRDDARDSLAAVQDSRAPGSLSAALVAATRAASKLRERADSVELVLISPFAAEEWDAATGGIRALWPDRARLVHTERAQDSGRGDVGELRVVGVAKGEEREGEPNPYLADGDPLQAAVELMGDSVTRSDVRIERGAMGAADSAWAAERGHVLVHWPATVPGDWPRRDRVDSAGAVVAGGAVLVADFVRAVGPPAGAERVMARWVDGVPAATERSLGEGCVRSVAIPFPSKGDLALGENARRFVQTLALPCGAVRDLAPLADSQLATLRGDTARQSARTLATAERAESRVALWLLIAAGTLLLVELLLRRAPTRSELEGAS